MGRCHCAPGHWPRSGPGAARVRAPVARDAAPRHVTPRSRADHAAVAVTGEWPAPRRRPVSTSTPCRRHHSARIAVPYVRNDFIVQENHRDVTICISRTIYPRDTILAIRYDTRCYFNVRSKADISQLNLPHGTDN